MTILFTHGFCCPFHPSCGYIALWIISYVHFLQAVVSPLNCHPHIICQFPGYNNFTLLCIHFIYYGTACKCRMGIQLSNITCCYSFVVVVVVVVFVISVIIISSREIARVRISYGCLDQHALPCSYSVMSSPLWPPNVHALVRVSCARTAHMLGWSSLNWGSGKKPHWIVLATGDGRGLGETPGCERGQCWPCNLQWAWLLLVPSSIVYDSWVLIPKFLFPQNPKSQILWF